MAYCTVLFDGACFANQRIVALLMAHQNLIPHLIERLNDSIHFRQRILNRLPNPSSPNYPCTSTGTAPMMDLSK